MLLQVLTSFILMEACRIRHYVGKENTDREPFAAAAFVQFLFCFPHPQALEVGYLGGRGEEVIRTTLFARQILDIDYVPGRNF